MEVLSPTLLFSGFEWLTAISSIGCKVCGWDAVGSVHRLSFFPGLQKRDIRFGAFSNPRRGELGRRKDTLMYTGQTGVSFLWQGFHRH